MFIVLRHIICPIAHGFVYSNYFFPYVHIGSHSSSETKRVWFFVPLQHYWGPLGFWRGLSRPGEEPWEHARGSNLCRSCWQAPSSSSGDTSARKPSIWGMILSLPMLLYSRKAVIPGIFLQGSLVLAVRELGETCPMMLLCQLKRVEYMGRGWAQE